MDSKSLVEIAAVQSTAMDRNEADQAGGRAAAETITLLGVLQHSAGYKTKRNCYSVKHWKQICESNQSHCKAFIKQFKAVCEEHGIGVNVKIVPSTLSLDEAIDLGATWVLIDRHVSEDKKSFCQQRFHELIRNPSPA